jgi:hypothetical protein
MVEFIEIINNTRGGIEGEIWERGNVGQIEIPDEHHTRVINGRVSEFGGRCRWWPRLVGDLALLGNDRNGKHYAKHWQTFMANWQNWQTAMANSYGKTAKNVIIRLIIVAIGVCHENSAKTNLRHLSH